MEKSELNEITNPESKTNIFRKKRLEKDKKELASIVELNVVNLVFPHDTDNIETTSFIEMANNQIQKLKVDLLTELENL